MKIFISILFTFLLFSIGCSEAVLEQTGDESSNFIVIKADPPVAKPGDQVSISAISDDGRGTVGTALIQIGNSIYADTNSTVLKIPSDISQLFGNEIARSLRSNGYVDVPVKVSSGVNSAQKYFRITGADYKPSLYDENPSIDSVTYSTSQTDNSPVDTDETIMFDPDSIPEKISFSVDEITINDNIKNNFIFSWSVFGTGSETPQIVESDENDGSVTFSLRDDNGAPITGKYRFYLVVKPEKTYPLTYEARYCIDFITFTVNTTGTDTVEEEDDNSTTDDSETEDI